MQTEKDLTGFPSIDKPWLKYYTEETINTKLPECTIYDYLWENNKDHTDDIAIIYLGKKITYGELFDKISACEKSLFALGVRENEIVTVAMPSIPEALYIVYALNKMGAVANMIHPLAGANEIKDYLNEVKSKRFLMFDGTYNIVKDVLSDTCVEQAVVVNVSESLPFPIKQLYRLKVKEPKMPDNSIYLSWKGFINLGKHVSVPKVNKDPNRVAIISHTGGTTGDPKGVMCSDKGINTVIWEIGCNIKHDRQETMMAVLPPFINYSLVNCMLEPLAFGFKTVLIPKYEPEKLGEYIAKYRPNHINSIPAYWEALLEIENIKTIDFSCLRNCFYGGEAMNTKKEEEINALFAERGATIKLSKGLGSTEMVSAATAAYPDCNLLGSVGIPLAKVNCKIVDPEDENVELTYNQEGEICFSGPQLMIGYYEKQDATDEIIHLHKDGERWIHTGDLGYLNEDGVLFVSGRIKRIIMTKGNDGVVTKMFPDRIEKVVLMHSAVGLCCVIGVADQQRINYPKACIVLNENHEYTETLEYEIKELCKQNLPEYMIPCEIAVYKDFPRTSRGKVDYRALEKEAEKL